MKGMFLFSTIVHAAFLALMVYMPMLSHKQVVYTPVYTVDLMALPESVPPPPPKKVAKPKPKKRHLPKPEKKWKPLEFQANTPDESILKKLDKFERKIKRTDKPKKRKKKEFEEATISKMLTNFEKKWEDGDNHVEQTRKSHEAEDIKEEREVQNDLLERLSKMEKEWSDSEQEQPAPKPEKAAPLKLDKQINFRQGGPASQTASPQVPEYLNRYYAMISSRINENWVDPLSTKLKEEEKYNPVVAYFEILSNGEIINARINESSGNDLLDSLAKDAIEKSSPLPPPPKISANDRMEVTFDFRYLREK